MSFLFPLYLLGAAAIAAPILLHLRRRPPKEHMEFGSLMFLEKSPERLSRRTRIERWLLLALRCLALIALALIFGRPYLESFELPTEAASGDRALILVDASASMHREDLWTRAIAEAEKVTRSFRSADELALAFFADELRMVGTFDTWKAMSASARLSAMQAWIQEKGVSSFPSWEATNPGAALVQAVDLMSDAEDGEKAGREEIILISDFQEGGEWASLNQLAWPEHIEVTCVKVEPEEEANFSLSLAAQPESSDEKKEDTYRVRISNTVVSAGETFTLEWKGFPETRVEGYVAPGSSRVISSPPRPAKLEKGTLVLQGDRHGFDNEVHIASGQPRPLPVLYLSNAEKPDEAGSPFFYLKRALQDTPSLVPSLTAAKPEHLEESLQMAEVAVVHGGWSEEWGGQLHAFAERGGLVMALTSEESTGEGLAKLMGDENWKLSPAGIKDYAMLADLDFEHPVLAPFARAGLRNFTKVRFWKARDVEIPGSEKEAVSVIAGFDSGRPAILEKPVGEGSVVVFLSGWEPRESQLVLSSKFVPILYSIFENAGYTSRSAPTSYVGSARYRNQDGVSVAAGKPGFYETKSEDGNRTSTIAVNLYPTEGRTAAIDPDLVLSEFGVMLSSGETKESALPKDEVTKQRFESLEKEKRQKLWKWLVLVILTLLVAETWLAGRRKAPVARESAA